VGANVDGDTHHPDRRTAVTALAAAIASALSPLPAIAAGPPRAVPPSKPAPAHQALPRTVIQRGCI
jgi:hypothetical protein